MDLRLGLLELCILAANATIVGRQKLVVSNGRNCDFVVGPLVGTARKQCSRDFKFAGNGLRFHATSGLHTANTETRDNSVGFAVNRDKGASEAHQYSRRFQNMQNTC